jgi:hypothetical protein
VAPLRPAPDARVIDSTAMSIEEVVESVLAEIERRAWRAEVESLWSRGNGAFFRERPARQDAAPDYQRSARVAVGSTTHVRKFCRAL